MAFYAMASLAAPAALDIPKVAIAPGVYMPSVSIGTWVHTGSENSSIIVKNWLDIGG